MRVSLNHRVLLRFIMQKQTTNTPGDPIIAGEVVRVGRAFMPPRNYYEPGTILSPSPASPYLLPTLTRTVLGLLFTDEKHRVRKADRT